MKTRSSIAAPPPDAGSLPGTRPAPQGPRLERSRRVRRVDPALSVFGAHPPSRSPSNSSTSDPPSNPPSPSRSGRASVEQLQRWSDSAEIQPVRQSMTLGELMHLENPTPETRAHMERLQVLRATQQMPDRARDDAPTAASVRKRAVAQSPRSAASLSATAEEGTADAAAKPRSIRAMRSGPKIDGMSDTLMSIYNLDTAKLSSLTEALGLGPAAPDERSRASQRTKLTRILRGAMHDGVPTPSPDSVKDLQFGRGLPAAQLESLQAAARNAGCFVSEREALGKDGEVLHLLQVHFQPSVDAGEQPLAAQPESVNHKAIETLAQHIADALAPEQRTDGRRFRIDFVASGRPSGGSAEVFARHFAQHAGVTPRCIQQLPETINDANIRNARFFAPLAPEQRERLVQLANTTHLMFEERASRGSDGAPREKLRIFFGGTQTLRDMKQAFASGVGAVGQTFGAVREAAELVALALDDAQRNGRRVEFESVAGISMGGASAQLFTAALQSRVKLDAHPPLVLFDPQLPNDAQARHAVRGGPLGYDYEKPRGVAITLDYPRNPRKSLMGRMKGLGFASPGLVRVKLALSDYDGRKWEDGEMVQASPEPSGPPGMGYHADGTLYQNAIERFTRETLLR